MSTLYCIAHKEDAKWMIGEKLDAMTNHAVFHKLYDLENVRTALKVKNMVAIKVSKEGIFEKVINPFIPA